MALGRYFLPRQAKTKPQEGEGQGEEGRHGQPEGKGGDRVGEVAIGNDQYVLWIADRRHHAGHCDDDA